MVNVAARTERQRVLLRRALIGTDGRANPEFLAHADDAGRAGAVRLPLWSGILDADLGLAKIFQHRRPARVNFEALFINAFNHRNTTVGGTGGATHQHRLDDVRPVHDVAIGARQIQFRLGFYF